MLQTAKILDFAVQQKPTVWKPIFFSGKMNKKAVRKKIYVWGLLC